ncbi:hypothetical protein HK096_009637, partial [Nowakowskiella sp. JEL0078]
MERECQLFIPREISLENPVSKLRRMFSRGKLKTSDVEGASINQNDSDEDDFDWMYNSKSDDDDEAIDDMMRDTDKSKSTLQ